MGLLVPALMPPSWIYIFLFKWQRSNFRHGLSCVSYPYVLKCLGYRISRSNLVHPRDAVRTLNHTPHPPTSILGSYHSKSAILTYTSCQSFVKCTSVGSEGLFWIPMDILRRAHPTPYIELASKWNEQLSSWRNLSRCAVYSACQGQGFGT